MATWRMSFRAGNQGQEMWPECCRRGIAAITYRALARTDLREHSLGEPKRLWAKLYPSQKASLRRLAREMRKGDTIYVKQGPMIIGKGIVIGDYRFDSSLSFLDRYGIPWSHQRPVMWDASFTPVRVLLGSEPLTVKLLSPADIQSLRSARTKAVRRAEAIDAAEGKAYIAEITFRSRNRSLVEAKKTGSEMRCEICGFSFSEKYGPLGKGYIIAHHIRPISFGPTRTRLDDVVLVCANCHAMIHRRRPPLSPNELRRRL